MSLKITGLQVAQDALRKELEKLQGGGYVLVGIHEDASQPEGQDITMATLGAIQHYGNDHIPARPWLDIGVEQGTKEYLEVIEEGAAAGLNQNQILEQVGAIAAGYVQQYITDLKTPPNAESTIKQKTGAAGRKALKGYEGESLERKQAIAGANPLIWTGAMRNSVTYKVAKQKPEEGI